MSGSKAKQARKQRPVGPFKPVSDLEMTGAWMRAKIKPVAVFLSPRFLATVYQEARGVLRITINRTRLEPGGSGRFVDRISWDELQDIKSQIGFGAWWGVEVYPSDDEVINDANMRHLFLLPEAPYFAWRVDISKDADGVV